MAFSASLRRWSLQRLRRWAVVRRQRGEIRPSLLVVIISSLTLSLGGSSLVVLAWLGVGLGRFPTESRIHLYLRPEISSEVGNALASELRQHPGTRTSTWIPRTLAWNHLTGNLIGEARGSLGPLPDKIEVTLEPEVDSRSLETRLAGLPPVEQVRSSGDDTRRFREIQRHLGRALGLGAAVLLIIAVAVCGITVELSMLQRRAELDLLSLVGADTRQLMTPFLRRGVAEGALAGGLAAVAVLTATPWLFRDSVPVGPFWWATVAVATGCGLPALGVLLCAGSAAGFVWRQLSRPESLGLP